MSRKIRSSALKLLVKSIVGVLGTLALAGAAKAAGTGYTVTNLISDDGTIPGTTADSSLINPWGIANLPGGPWWIANNNSGTTEIYTGTGQRFGSPISIPASSPTNGPAPTGVVANTGSGFMVNGNPAKFIFDGEDGTVSGWNGGSSATRVVNNGTNAVYKGLAIGTVGSNTFLYAANFRAGTVDVFNSSFQATTLTGSFADSSIPAGFAPFGIQNINNNIYVTYAMQNPAKHDDVSGPGNGFVDKFSLQGVLEQRLIQQGQLNSPWGLAQAPSNFGQFSNDLLVANFGNGWINAFNPTTGTFVGTLSDPGGTPIVVGDLWSIKFADGGMTGATNSLFFTGGVSMENHGVFGHIDAATTGGVNAVPAPAAVWMTLPGLGLAIFAARRFWGANA